MEDHYLEDITPLLMDIIDKKVPDVRKALRKYRDQIMRKEVYNGAQKP